MPDYSFMPFQKVFTATFQELIASYEEDAGIIVVADDLMKKMLENCESAFTHSTSLAKSLMYFDRTNRHLLPDIKLKEIDRTAVSREEYKAYLKQNQELLINTLITSAAAQSFCKAAEERQTTYQTPITEEDRILMLHWPKNYWPLSNHLNQALTY